MDTYNVIGLMSGSSLDGLDIAYCKVSVEDGKWSYEIIHAECIPLPPKWQLRLEKLVLQNAITYIKTHTFLGHFVGEEVKGFISRHGIDDELDFIASHGQTIFHQPENRFTSQICDGAAIAAHTGHAVISDFRTSDVALGGQGTPITPIADKYFYPDYKYFLNLGGIANFTFNLDGRYIAFDVTATNLILNKLAKSAEMDFDKDGELASKGSVNNELLEELNGSWYYEKEYPKSLSGGWVSKVIWPIVKRSTLSLEDKLCTVVEHIALQLSNSIKQVEDTEGIKFSSDDKILVSGGGAFNTFLIERISDLISLTVEVPDDETVTFKEAVMIALMGILRARNEINCLSSVTGATMDSIGGAIYYGKGMQFKAAK